MEDEVRIAIKSDEDVLNARQQGRALAARLGFSSVDLTLISTAISEIARNIATYARRGEMVFKPGQRGPKKGIVVIACDQGPGNPRAVYSLPRVRASPGVQVCWDFQRRDSWRDRRNSSQGIGRRGQ